MKQSTEFKNFDNAMRRVLTVSKEELERRIEADRKENSDKPKRGPKPKK